MKVLMVLAAMTAAMTASAATCYRAEMTFAADAVDAELTDYPVLVRVSESAVSGFSYAACGANGANVWFTSDAEGENPLPHEVDTWKTDGESLFWVKVPTVQNGGRFYMFWGDATPPANDPTRVWSDYVCVFHFNEPAGTNAFDSTANHLDANAFSDDAAAFTEVAGMIGSGRSKTVGTQFTIPDYSSLGVGSQFTLSCYIRASERTSYEAFWAHKSAWNVGNGYQCNMQNSNTYLFLSGSGATTSSNSQLPNVVNTWTSLTLVYNNTSLKAYNKGAEFTTRTIAATGEYAAPLRFDGFKGIADEMRLRKGAVSAAWVKADYQQTQRTDFVTAGTAEVLGDDVVLVGATPERFGTASSAYGSVSGLSAGAEVPVSVVTPVDIEEGVRAVCTGWKLYDVDGNLVSRGDATSFTYTHPAPAASRKLVWQWECQHLVGASAAEKGSVSKSEEWVPAGTPFTVTATPSEGHCFYRWLDGNGNTVSRDASISVKADEPMTLTAEFGDIIHVETTGDDVNGDGSADYPYKTVEKGVDAAQDGDMVIVGDGEFQNTNICHTLTRAVTVRSKNGPAKTTLIAKSSGMHFRISNAEALVSGFTLRDAFVNDWSYPSSLLMSAGMVSNCVITGTLRTGYFSICKLNGSAKVVDCDFDASGYNGSSYYDSMEALVLLEGNAVADRCRMHGWVSTAGANGITGFHKSAVVLNSANAVLRNCLVYGNGRGSSTTTGVQYSGGGVMLANGTVENCTIVGNVSSGYGGGICVNSTNGKIINTIVWGNTSRLGIGNDIFAPSLASSKMSYICSEAIGDTTSISNGVGVGCSSVNPAFDETPGNEYRLTQLSVSCLDKGGVTTASSAAGAKDLDGNPRLDEKNGIVDIGCFEFVYSSERVPLTANITLVDPGTIGPHDVSFVAIPVGDDQEGLSYCWNFGDGETSTEGLSVTHTYQPGRYEPFLALTNEAGESTNVYASVEVVVIPQIAYVAVDGSETYPYDTWEKATTNLATAIEVGSPEVLVGDGTFVNTVYEHVINRSLVLHSLNGPGKTILKRRPSGGRHFNVSDNTNTKKTLIAGFTCYGASGGFNTEGFFRIAGGVVSNCVFTGDMAGNYHKFCYLYGHGTAVDCEFDGSVSGARYCPTDGSMYMLSLEGYAVADRCYVHDMRITSGDSASSGQKFSPVLVNSANAVFKNSLVRNCSSRRSAGGTNYVAALSGGGIRVINGTVANCTVVNCSSSGNGGGIWATSANGKIINCIAWNNTCSGTGGKDIHAPSLAAEKVTYCCASDFGNDAAVKTGTGCISADPHFVSPVRGDFRLKSGSPCREAGDNSYWTDIGSVFDLLDNPRLIYSRVDMGCYETPAIGFRLIVR